MQHRYHAPPSSGVIFAPTISISGSASGSVTTIVITTNSPGQIPSSVSPSASALRYRYYRPRPPRHPHYRYWRPTTQTAVAACLRANNNGSRLPTKNRVRLLLLRPPSRDPVPLLLVGLGIWGRHEMAPCFAQFPNKYISMLLRLRGFGCRRVGSRRGHRRGRWDNGNNVCRVAM